MKLSKLVGKDALAETDKIVLETVKLLREDYLAQSAFTPYDRFCPFYNSVWMMRNIIHFNTLANQAIERGAGPDGQKIIYKGCPVSYYGIESLVSGCSKLV